MEIDKGWYRISSMKNTGTVSGDQQTALYLLQEIASYGSTVDEFEHDFLQIPARNIELHINSIGGSVLGGYKIYNLIKNARESGKNITTIINGVAASIAAFDAMAGHPVKMYENSLLMIHEVTSDASGTSDEIRKGADLVDKMNAQIAAVYAAKSGKPISQIRGLMKATTYFTGKEARAFGLVDELLQGGDLPNVDEKGFRNKCEILTSAKFKAAYNKLNPQREEKKMITLESLKNDAPDLYKSVLAAGAAEAATAAENKAKTDATAATTKERERISALVALNKLPGADVLVEKAIKDGSTAEQVAHSILINALNRKDGTDLAALNKLLKPNFNPDGVSPEEIAALAAKNAADASRASGTDKKPEQAEALAAGKAIADAANKEVSRSNKPTTAPVSNAK